MYNYFFGIQTIFSFKGIIDLFAIYILPIKDCQNPK